MRLTKISRVWLLILACLLGSALAADASLYLSYGQDRFNVRIVNSSYKDIQDARGSVMVNGTNARIQVEAPGYRGGYEYVYMNPNNHNYYVTVRMEDPMNSADVVDTTGKFVQGSFTDTFSQGMYWGDEFGIRASFPKVGFTQLTERRMDVRVNGLWAFAPRVYLTGNATTWQVEIVIKRRDMSSFSNNIRIILTPDDATPPTNRKVEPIVLASDYQQNQILALSLSERGTNLPLVLNRLESVARQLREILPTLDEGQRRDLLGQLGETSPLGRELKGMASFQALHNE